MIKSTQLLNYLVTKSLFAIFFFLFAIVFNLYSAGEFLLIPENASSFSLGGVNSLTSGVNKNPTSLFSSNGNFISFSELLYPEETKISNFKIIFPYKKSYIAFGFRNLNSPDIRGYDENGYPTENFYVKEQLFNLGYSFKFKKAKFGFSLNGFVSQLKDKKASSFFLDFGSNLELTENFYFDFFVSNIGGSLKYESNNEKLPLDLNFSLTYSTFLDNLKFFLQSSSLRGQIFSALWRLNDNLVLKTGYNFEKKRANNLFLGFEIGWKNFNINYSFSQFSEFSNINYFTISYRWGRKNKLLIYKEEIEKTRKRAIRYYRENKLFKSRDEFLKILSINPNDRSARFYVSRIEEEIAFLSSKSEADKLFKEGVKKYLDGDLIASYRIFSKVLLLDPDYKEAKEYLKKVEEDIKEFERNSLILEYLEEARRFEKKRDFEKAIKLVDEALNISEENIYIRKYKKELIDKWIALLFVEGNALLNKGNLEDALKVYNKILELNPDNSTASKKIGEIYTLKAVRSGKGEVVGEILDFEYDNMKKKYYLVLKLKKEFKEGEILILKNKGRIKVLDRIKEDLYNGITIDEFKPETKDKILLP